MNKYYPYKSDKPNKKYYIITNDNKKVYFGATGYEQFSSGHKDEARRQRYIDRHKKNESKYWNKSGIDTPSFWSRFLLWNKPTIKKVILTLKEDSIYNF